METDPNLTRERPNKEPHNPVKAVERGIFSLLSTVIYFLAVAVIVSLAWNHIVVDMFSGVFNLPQVTPLQVAGIKFITNYINPFK